MLKQNFFVRSVADDVRLYCDYPPDARLPVGRDVVQFRGWALAWSGIEQVTIQIGDMSPLHRRPMGLHAPMWLKAFRTFRSRALRLAVFLGYTCRAGRPLRGPHHRNGSKWRCSTITMALLVDQACDPEYSQWIAENEPLHAEEKKAMAAEIDSFERRPKISIVVPVYKTPRDLLARCIDSVLAQIYPAWELCLADDGSNDPQLTQLLESYCERDPRIRVTALENNLGISGATNAALRICTGDYIGFLDSDDELADFALRETVKAINEDPRKDLFNSDEDKIDENGRRYGWFFKPEWSPELFFSCNYLCHFIVIRRWVFDRVKGLDESYRGGTQDYEFLLRVD